MHPDIRFLHELIRRDRAEDLSGLLDEGFSPDAQVPHPDHHRRSISLLALSAGTGALGCAQLLLARGCSVDPPNPKSRTAPQIPLLRVLGTTWEFLPLVEALNPEVPVHRRRRMVALLLEHGVPWTMADVRGRTAVDEAVLQEDWGCLRDIMAHARIHGDTPDWAGRGLWWLARSNDEALARCPRPLLIQMQQDFGVFHRWSWTACVDRIKPALQGRRFARASAWTTVLAGCQGHTDKSAFTEAIRLVLYAAAEACLLLKPPAAAPRRRVAALDRFLAHLNELNLVAPFWTALDARVHRTIGEFRAQAAAVRQAQALTTVLGTCVLPASTGRPRL